MGVALVIAVLVLAAWVFHALRDAERAAREREAGCPHRAEWQQTIRISQTPFPVVGRRWLVKHCRGCGRQRHLYSSTLQSWESYVAEFRQETRDRAAEYRARRRLHEVESVGRDAEPDSEAARAADRGGEPEP